jgi:hypothetical protein
MLFSLYYHAKGNDAEFRERRTGAGNGENMF